MSKYLGTVKDIIAAWDSRDFDRFLAYVTDDIEYHSHVGSPPFLGKQAFKDFLSEYDKLNTDVEWTILNYAENGDKLMVEGLVEQKDTGTGDPVRHAYMGIFEFRDGKVCGWRDYFQK